MKKILRMSLIAIILFAIIFINGLLLTSGSTLAETEKKYMAGNLNGPICSCPVLIGNCVCEITVPK